jgi:hypothetical protein
MACETNCTVAGQWTKTLLAENEWRNPSLAVGPGGQARLVVAFQDPNTYEPLVAYLECASGCSDGSQWLGTVLVGTATSGANSDNAFVLRLDASGRPRLALYPGTGDGGDLPPNRLYYLTCDSNCASAANWSANDIGLDNYAGEGGLDLALDAQNRPRLAYRLPAPTDELAYAWCNANCGTSQSDWHARLVPTTALAQQQLPIDPMQGCPSPRCIPPIPPCTSAFWDAGYWPSLALDPAGHPRIGFDIKHQQFGGGCTSGTDARFAWFVGFDQP